MHHLPIDVSVRVVPGMGQGARGPERHHLLPIVLLEAATFDGQDGSFAPPGSSTRSG